jgi:hypothetical protein
VAEPVLVAVTTVCVRVLLTRLLPKLKELVLKEAVVTVEAAGDNVEVRWFPPPHPRTAQRRILRKTDRGFTSSSSHRGRRAIDREQIAVQSAH